MFAQVNFSTDYLLLKSHCFNLQANGLLCLSFIGYLHSDDPEKYLYTSKSRGGSHSCLKNRCQFNILLVPSISCPWIIQCIASRFIQV